MNGLLMVGEHRNALCGVLESRGFTPTVITGELDDFEPAETCAVIVQLGSARGDSFRLIYRLRRALPRMPIVAIAPFHDQAVEEHASRCGATFVLTEPLNPDHLATFLDGYTGMLKTAALS